MNGLRRWLASLLPPLDPAACREGARTMLPASLAIASWGLVTGVAMVKSGLSVPLALVMTFTAFAGSAQLATLPLIVLGTPLPIVWLTAFVVNLRFVIFSAGLRAAFMSLTLRQRLLAGYISSDMGFVLFLQRFGSVPERGNPQQWGYFYAGAVTNWLSWQSASVAGILLASLVPAQWGLELAAVLALSAVLIPLTVSVPAFLGVLVAGALSLVTAGFPLRLGLLVSVLGGVAAAVLVETFDPRVRLRAGAVPEGEN
jgi:predicted branched-subunit amino acid permease